MGATSFTEILSAFRAHKPDALMTKRDPYDGETDTKKDGTRVEWTVDDRGYRYAKVVVPPEVRWQRLVASLRAQGFQGHADQGKLREALRAYPQVRGYVREGLSVVLAGQTGSHKTTLAVALALEDCQREGRGEPAFKYWPVWREQLRDFEGAKKSGAAVSAKAVTEAVKPGRLLIVDEVGFDGKRGDWSDFDQEMLQVLVTLADSSGAQVILTTNMGESEMRAQWSAPTWRRVRDNSKFRRVLMTPAKES